MKQTTSAPDCVARAIVPRIRKTTLYAASIAVSANMASHNAAIAGTKHDLHNQEKRFEMKKMPTIFERDWDGDRSCVVNQPHPDCDWVFAGEGTATRKLDGTCCLVDGGKLFRRREVRKGKEAPNGFVSVMTDEKTGKQVGWVPVSQDPGDKWHQEAFSSSLIDGTYELVGPKVQGNPEGFAMHTLVKHSDAKQYADAPVTYEELKTWLAGKDIEGLVWHHPDGRMAKIKLKDFGLKRDT